MKLFVGLGNPGDKYQNNRHNVGFMFADALIEYLRNKNGEDVRAEKNFDSIFSKFKVGNDTILISKPQTFMNRSGEAINSMLSFYKVKPEDLYIAHDDLDIPLGKYKVQQGIGPKQHNGLLSVQKYIHEDTFWTIRIGVDNRPRENRLPGEAYVLSDFTSDERNTVDNVLTQCVVAAL